MTNHVRTLLLNAAAEPTGITAGEEFVPAAFRPVLLPEGLRAASDALFGVGADRCGKNLQLARILCYLHASPLSEYVTADDPRITYNPASVLNVFDRIGATVTPAAVGWYGSESFPQPGAGGGAWVVTTIGSGGYTVTPRGGTGSSGTVTTVSGGDAVPLPGSNLSLVVGTGAAGTWSVGLVVPPTHNFTAAGTAGDPDAVFRPSRSAAESAWFDAWSSPVAALRAGAFALALAARTKNVIDGIDF